MDFMPITPENLGINAESPSAAIPSQPEAKAQLSEFNNILSSSLAGQGPVAEPHALPPAMALALRSPALTTLQGQELPLTGSPLPPESTANGQTQIASLVQPGSMHSIGSATPSALTTQAANVAPGQDLANRVASQATKQAQAPTINSAMASSPKAMAVDAGKLLIHAMQSGTEGTKNMAPLQAAVSEASASQSHTQRSPLAMTQATMSQILPQSAQGMLQQGGAEHSGAQGESHFMAQMAEARLSVAADGPDLSRMIEKGLAQLNRDVPVNTTPLSQIENTARPLQEGLKPGYTQLLLQQAIDKPSWSQEFGSRMVWMSKEGLQNAQIRLTPAHLGTIEVRISIQNDQANVSFMSQHSAVRDVIESSLPRLRDMLQDAGVKLEQANVSSGDSNNTNPQQRQADKSPARFMHPNPASMDESEALMADLAGSTPQTGPLSAVDYYA